MTKGRTHLYDSTGWEILQAPLDMECSVDQFWFTFFHEAGHILKHGKRDVFINTEDIELSSEQARLMAALFAHPVFRAFLIDQKPSTNAQ